MRRAAGGAVAVGCVLRDRHRAAFRDLVADHVDILFANEAEITALYERNTFEEAAAEAAREEWRWRR